MLTNFKFNPANTTMQDPKNFKGTCELWTLEYSFSRAGFPMIVYTWKYQDTLFKDYRSVKTDQMKEREIQYLGLLCNKCGEDPQQFIEIIKPETLDELLQGMCQIITSQCRFTCEVERKLRNGSTFYDVIVNTNTVAKVQQ